ncbi:hypothetical protein HMPREF1531_00050 [Propionibacterium sp. oral taxon 192 str. F0372]|nr:hypothetical protein HMPREF1531_00050 [Propionibacterium sp. oral taxon 192 str. F0372]
MAPSQVTREWRDWVGLITRIILGCGLFYAGALKVGNLAANVAQVELYQLPVPSWAETVIGTIQPFLEIAVGLMLILGLFTRVNAILGALAMAVFIAGIIWAWSNGIQIDCGCFSVGGKLEPGEQNKYLQDIVRDLGFIACGLWSWIRPRSILAVDNWLLKPIDIRTTLDETDTTTLHGSTQ